MLAGQHNKLYLRKLKAKRLWGFAPKYVEMMWLMLKQDEPDDYVVGTGESHSIREFVNLAFLMQELKSNGKAQAPKKKGSSNPPLLSSHASRPTSHLSRLTSHVSRLTSHVSRLTSHVSRLTSHPITPGTVPTEIDPRYFRPTEVEHLQADITKARQKLGWQPRVTFPELVKIMVDYDLKMVGIDPPGEGIAICQTKNFCYTEHVFASNEKMREQQISSKDTICH